MESTELDALLGLMKDLHVEVERYLTDAGSCLDAIPRILDVCTQMRTRELSESANFWLSALERNAGEIFSPRPRPGVERRLLTSSVFLGSQLLKDAYYLRTAQVDNHRSIT